MYKKIVVLSVVFLLGGCLFGEGDLFGEDSGPTGNFPIVHTDVKGGVYEGGAYKVWVTLGGVAASADVLLYSQKRDSLKLLLQTPLATLQRLRVEEEYNEAFEELGKHVNNTVAWTSASGVIAYHDPVIFNGMIVSDTAYIIWESLPVPHIDSTVSGELVTYDSTFTDTVNVVVNSDYSNDIAITIQNIAPRLDSLKVNGLVSPTRSENYREPISLYGRAGQDLFFTLYLSDAYKESTLNPEIELIGFPVINEGLGEDAGSYMFKLELPYTEMDTIVTLHISDSYSLKYREYRVRVIAYEEIGSMWIGDEDGLTKVTSNGTKIFRVTDAFSDISSIAIDPTTKSTVWVTDEGAGKLMRYSENGILDFADTSYISPRAVALDHDSKVLWIASGLNGAGIVKSLLINDTALTELTADSISQGYVSDITIDYSENSAWYVNPVTDSLFMSHDTGTVMNPAEFQSFFTFNKPVSISFDQSTGQLWVADSSTVYLLGSNGTGIDSIVGFQEVSKISAANGICWIVDTKAQQVVKLSNTDMSLFQTVSALAAGVNLFLGFSHPLGVVIDESDNGCWVTDTEVGSIVKLDANGVEVLRRRSFNRPSVIAINQ